jgi:mannose-1-phosphate guanylyltransferase
MQALVLVGGEGTRLRPLTLTRPKPAITLVDRPFIGFMVEWLGRHRIDEVVMACGFRAEDLRSALGDEIPGGPRITYVEEPVPLGTAGPVRLAADRGLLGERFMVLNGDVLTDLDLTALQSLHAEREATATLALYPVPDPTHYGLVRRAGGPPAPGAKPPEPGGEVLEFIEKPQPDAIVTDEISAGAYVLEASVVDLIPDGRAVSIEREIFPQLVGRGLFARRLEGYWMDIGTPDRYLQASWDILEGSVTTDLDGRGGPLVAADAEVASDARIAARAVVGPACQVGSGAIVRESVLFDGCEVGAGAVVEGSILAPGVVVGSDANIGEGSVLGEGARVASGARIEAGSRLAPGDVVGDLAPYSSYTGNKAPTQADV